MARDSRGMGDGNAHDFKNLPILLAGRGGNFVQPGQHLRFPEDTPLANLYFTLPRRFGIQQERFADRPARLNLG